MLKMTQATLGPISDEFQQMANAVLAGFVIERVDEPGHLIFYGWPKGVVLADDYTKDSRVSRIETRAETHAEAMQQISEVIERVFVRTIGR